MVKKEIFAWLKDGIKNIDVRKGNPRQGNTAVFMSGPNILRLTILKKETGTLDQIIRDDNYRFIIPTALTLQDAFNYLQAIYGSDVYSFTAYHLASK